MLEPDYRDPTDEERSEFMDKVTSRDGTQIAFDRLGDGPPVLVGGASPAWTIDIGRQVADAMPNGSTVSWKARSTSCLPRCSCRCWQSSSPDATNLIDGGDLVCCSGTKSVTFQGTEGGVRPG
jgi:hypothetical protein